MELSKYKNILLDRRKTIPFLEKYGCSPNVKSADVVIYECFVERENLLNEREMIYSELEQEKAKFDELLKEHLSLLRTITKNGDNNGQ